ncbi:periodic tryptophan protein 2 homolog [Lycorma delicatula]|uniref:periodic tryptophan protein 2 homolog n=1 Tax=Lycorma delicatula TaxID=130591 RepID=UPI003F51A07E
MKFQYQFSNLLGSVYKKGNLLFTNDGNCVISPVGNRITMYDLKNNKSSTLPVESRYNFDTIALSPNGSTLIAVNEVGSASIISMISRRVIHKYEFKRPVCCVKFSPDGKYFAACKQNNVFIFKSPEHFGGQFNPFEMEKVIHGSFDETICLDWSSDSRIIAVGSKDTSARVYSLQKLINFRQHTLSSVSDAVVAVFFEKNSLDITTISRNGQVCIWESNLELNELKPLEPSDFPKKKKSRNSEIIPEEEEDDIDLSKGELRAETTKQTETTDKQEDANDDDGNSEEIADTERLKYKRISKHYLSDLIKGKIKLTAADYHRDTHILITGFSNGSFFIHELPEVNLIHSLSISENSLTSLTINNAGDWVAVGCSKQGQLLVWEWQSETYVMKQQAHSSTMSCLSYSIDGLYIATGGEDGKVKLWNTQTGFCFVTFNEHTSGVMDIRFANNRKFLVSASLDGTVRAFDMTRYRNFRTFTSPRPVQFACLALDATGEFVAAGGQDVFEIYLWSLKIGRLLEILTGHEGPVVSIAFSPILSSTTLASVSWDKSLRIWNAVERGTTYESIKLISDGLCVAFNPNGKEVVVGTLNGHLTMFDIETSAQTGSIEGRNDLGSGRSDTDLITAKKSLAGKAFTTVCYSADGNYILAGGQSKNVCIYHAKEEILIKKFEITQNRSFDAVDDFVNRRKMTEFGNLALVEEREEKEGGNVSIRLPGVRKGDMAARIVKPEVKVFSLQFSPTGQAWAAVTTEGLLIYSLDSGHIFDPFQLEIGITPDSTKSVLKEEKYSEALMMSLRLNERNLIQEVIESVPPTHIDLCVSILPRVYIEKTLQFIANSLEQTRHIEFHLLWIKSLILACNSPPPPIYILHTLHKNLNDKYQQLSKICDFNKYTLRYLSILGSARKKLKSNYNDGDENDDMFVDDSDLEDLNVSKMETD